MYDSSGKKASHRQQRCRRDPPPNRHRSWCCSFTVPPRSPENSSILSHLRHCHLHSNSRRNQKSGKTEIPSKSTSSFPNSPQSTKLGRLGKIDTRRILSPGRVSPIDPVADDSIQELIVGAPDPNPDPDPDPEPSAVRAGNDDSKLADSSMPEGSESSDNGAKDDDSMGIFDVRLNLKGKNGDSLVLELNSEVLCANSSVFADLVADYRKNAGGPAANLCRIEVPDLVNLHVFRETIELMFEEDIMKRLLNVGVYRSIDILEVSTSIMFNNGVYSCLKYLEAMPWSEEEEEKLRRLFSKFKFEGAGSRDILARLYSLESVDSQQTLARQLVWSITTCVDANARDELKSLVKGLLCRSSVCDDHPGLNKEDIFVFCQSCLGSMVSLFEEASGINPCAKLAERETDKPLLERISKQVDNINWLLDILLDWQMAEEFVDMWADQRELLRMHGTASPIVRYELSRVSAMLFIAMGTGKLHCRSEARSRLLQTWFKPMLLDFGWLRRCRKGLDMRALEEAMGQALLTLPLQKQYSLFMEWFRCFSMHGTECPNLSKAFQIWWRRSFLSGSESNAIESR